MSTTEIDRVRVEGKFLRLGDDHFFLRGVTYGPFRPDESGCEYGAPEQVRGDFARMAENGINSVRVYTTPPRWLLDEALEQGLRVLVGLPWEQHVTFLDDPRRCDSIIDRVRMAAGACGDHPAVLGFAVGNEIPAPIVRWHGRKKIEAFLKRLYDIVKTDHPNTLVTYVNYPSSEYLDLSFVDFFCFNVYLEDREALTEYLARLQNLADEKPMVLAEVGLDSMRNGDDAQAETLGWQIETIFAAGATGIFVFAWTDEWHRGGNDITDWAFGLTAVDREPKPALHSVSHAFGSVPFPESIQWPRASVLVCTHNGSSTLDECLSGIAQLDYPDFEIVVVNDGSTDHTEEVARKYNVNLITIENQGLSNARNVAAQAATGEIVAYIDDDAYPDKYWLKYIAHTFMTTDVAAVGGPNLPPKGDGWAADCVANAPGGPTHVLLSDRVAEHIPGCNMAFRRDILLEIGGFDDQFWIAGDDVDCCWRIQESGRTIGFSPSAFVWHHRRNAVGRYLRQQFNYGRAEAMLERKWPQKYNAVGHIPWEGRIYGRGSHRSFLPGRSRIYHGVWGAAPFQRVYEPANDLLSAIMQMPEWYYIIVMLGGLSLLGFAWTPLFAAAPLFALALAVLIAHGVLGGAHADFVERSPNPLHRLGKRVVTGSLYILQPMSRLRGRLRGGLTPWRRRGAKSLTLPRQTTYELWHLSWRSYDDHLAGLVNRLQEQGSFVRRASEFDRVDLIVRGGLLGSLSVLMGVEEHGDGKQMVRYRVRPIWRRRGWVPAVFLGMLALGAAASHAWLASAILATATVFTVLRAAYECTVALSTVEHALRTSEEGTFVCASASQVES